MQSHPQRRRRDDEPTLRLDLERRELRPEDKLVIGYLTMEAHGMFAPLSFDEQQRAADHLRR